MHKVGNDMYNGKIFASQLAQLFKDFDKKENEVAKELNIQKSTIYKYYRQERMPRLDVVLKIADYFSCRVNYLVGIEKDYVEYKPRECPTVSSRLKHYMDIKNKKVVDLVNDLNLQQGTVSNWLNGNRIPNIDGIMIIANYFNLSVDDFLGR